MWHSSSLPSLLTCMSASQLKLSGGYNLLALAHISDSSCTKTSPCLLVSAGFSNLLQATHRVPLE